MGGSQSSNVSKTATSIMTKSTNSCNQGNASNQLFLNGINYNPPPASVCADAGTPQSFSISQSATVDATCYLSALQDNVAANASNLNANAQAGLGISSASNTTDTKQQLQTFLNNTCKGASTSQTVNASNINSTGCVMTFVQNANANTACQINAVQSALSQASTSQQNTATGGSILGDLVGNGWTSIIVMVIVLIVVLGMVGVGGYFAYRWWSNRNAGEAAATEGTEGVAATTDDTVATEEPAEETADQEGGNFFNKHNYAITIIMILLVLAVVFVAFSTSPTTTITSNDLQNLRNKVVSANQIADLNNGPKITEPMQSVVPDPIYPDYHSYTQQNIYPAPQQTMVRPFDGPVYYDNLRTYYEPLI